MITVYKNSTIDWKPSPVIALATSPDDSQVAAARADNTLEIWLVSPGSVGWHCQLTIHGDPNSRVSSLAWCRSGSRLLSSNIDGSISEWDLTSLRQKTVLETIGVTIWKIAEEPLREEDLVNKQEETDNGNGRASTPIDSDVDDEEEESESESESSDDDEEGVEVHDGNDETKRTRLALACDDGCVRIYYVSDDESLVYNRTLPRVAGRTLSVAWSTDSSKIYSGSSDGFIRCWDAKLGQEIYRITVGRGGVGSGSDLCIWSLLALRCGSVVSGDSSGCVQFWDGQFGTLLQAHSYHKGDVNALAAAPSHTRVFSAGSDGQVVLYKLSSDSNNLETIKKWIYVGYVRAHTHDLRAMTVAVPISHEDSSSDEAVKRPRCKSKNSFSYHKWAHLGVPMLISGSDDTKLFAYSIKDFTKFSPHDICPAPQRMPMQLVPKTVFDQTPLLLMQATNWVDIYCVRLKNSVASPSTSVASLDLVARVKCKASRKIICSTISSSGSSFCYSDHLKPSLFELKTSKSSKNSWTVNKKKLPPEIPFAHSMVYTSDSTRLILAGHDRKIYVVDIGSSELVHHTFTPRRDDVRTELTPSEPPITKMFTSADNQWLAAINCFGDLYVFNLETLRQHWFVSRLDGASVTAAGFTPKKASNILIISTSSNQVYALDVESKQLGEWSKNNTSSLPKRYQEFPGEVTGLSFQPSSSSSSVIVYSPRAMCLIDFGMPVDKDTGTELPNGLGLTAKIHGNGLKRKLEHQDTKNFELCAFRDPVLFVEHLSKNSILVIDKQWVKVVKTFDTQPVHRHIYGT